MRRSLRGSAKIARARLAGTNFAEMLEAENSRRVTIGKLILQRVIPHRVGALGGDARLVHRQNAELAPVPPLAFFSRSSLHSAHGQ